MINIPILSSAFDVKKEAKSDRSNLYIWSNRKAKFSFYFYLVTMVFYVRNPKLCLNRIEKKNESNFVSKKQLI